MLGLDVGWILVALVQCHLCPLRDPDLHLIDITRELLQRLSLTKLGAVLQQSFLQARPSVEKKR